ncbi:hypothetical protein SRHO_G00167870 [Serrasalmus rhombeus]
MKYLLYNNFPQSPLGGSLGSELHKHKENLRITGVLVEKPWPFPSLPSPSISNGCYGDCARPRPPLTSKTSKRQAYTDYKTDAAQLYLLMSGAGRESAGSSGFELLEGKWD